jgi:hypothetical protein
MVGGSCFVFFSAAPTSQAAVEFASVYVCTDWASAKILIGSTFCYYFLTLLNNQGFAIDAKLILKRT